MIFKAVSGHCDESRSKRTDSLADMNDDTFCHKNSFFKGVSVIP